MVDAAMMQQCLKQVLGTLCKCIIMHGPRRRGVARCLVRFLATQKTATQCITNLFSRAAKWLQLEFNVRRLWDGDVLGWFVDVGWGWTLCGGWFYEPLDLSQGGRRT